MLENIEINGKSLKDIWMEEEKSILDIVFEYEKENRIEESKKDDEVDEFIEILLTARELQRKGKDVEAFKLYDFASKINPINPETFYQKGLILGRHQLITKAIREMEKHRIAYEKEMRRDKIELEKLTEEESNLEEDIDFLIREGRIEDLKNIYEEMYKLIEGKEGLEDIAKKLREIIEGLE